MSSGEILSAPDAADVAAAAVAVATVVVAALLAVRAASAATEAAARTAGEFGTDLENAAGGQSEAGVREPVWGTVAAYAVEINARIRMLAERVERAGVAVALPKPLSLSGLTVAEAAEQSRQTARRLRGAQAALRTAVAEDEARRVAAQLTHSLAIRPGTRASLAGFQDALLERCAGKTPATTGLSVTITDVDTILLALDPDANEREHAYVLSAAAHVLRDDPHEVRAYVRTLRAKVAAVNEAVARRRLCAQWLCALEEPVVAAVEPPGPFLGTAARLRAVVAGDEDLTEELRARGAEAVEWAAEVTRQRFVYDEMSNCLAGQGYVVDGEFDPEQSVELRLTRPDWRGEHSAEVWMDRHGAVHGRVVREKAMLGDQAVEDERVRCAGFNADIRTLGRRLNADVVVENGYVPQDRTAEQM